MENIGVGKYNLNTSTPLGVDPERIALSLLKGSRRVNKYCAVLASEFPFADKLNSMERARK